MNVVTKTIYVHRGKDSNWDLCRELWGDTDKAEQMYREGFKYFLGELAIDVEINLESGRAKIVSVENL